MSHNYTLTIKFDEMDKLPRILRTLGVIEMPIGEPRDLIDEKRTMWGEYELKVNKPEPAPVALNLSDAEFLSACGISERKDYA